MLLISYKVWTRNDCCKVNVWQEVIFKVLLYLECRNMIVSNSNHWLVAVFMWEVVHSSRIVHHICTKSDKEGFHYRRTGVPTVNYYDYLFIFNKFPTKKSFTPQSMSPIAHGQQQQKRVDLFPQQIHKNQFTVKKELAKNSPTNSDLQNFTRILMKPNAIKLRSFFFIYIFRLYHISVQYTTYKALLSIISPGRLKQNN
jgi:hypothetical protein